MLTSNFTITIYGNVKDSNDIDWQKFRKLSYCILGGKFKTGLTYEEYKLNKPWPIKKNADR